MDQVFFSVKRAHHAGLRFLRRFLSGFGLTPARFDMLSAIAREPTQKEVTRVLGLARATVSEMMTRLEELGLIWRERLRRTKMVFLTKKGRDLMRRAIDAGINTGHVQLSVDAMLVRRDPERKAVAERLTMQRMTSQMRRAFGDTARRDFYVGWHPDYWRCAVIDVEKPVELIVSPA